MLALAATTSLFAGWILPQGVYGPPLIRAQPACSRSARLELKKAPDEAPEERPEVNVAQNSICEFHEHRAGGGGAAPLLGLVQGVEYKAKGGARIQIMDASGSVHTVREQDIHINLGSYKGKLQEPSEILAEYEAVMQTEPLKLGVEPELLEMAWELAAESEQKTHSLKFLLSLVDENFIKSQVDRYKAFRLMTSDMGKIFFKSLNADEYKVKATKAVRASKENWCRALEGEEDWCFV